MEKLEVKYSGGKIYSPLKGRYLDKKPEEIVRQEFICDLVNEYGYSLNCMDQEVKLTYSQRGKGRASADLVVWASEEDKAKNKTAFLVVELKAKGLKLKVEDCYQGQNYATWSRAKLFAISNGSVLQVYKTVEDELPINLRPVSDIPHYEDIKDDKRLEKFLSKTKEFKGDEFAKLLHKCHDVIRNSDKLSPEASFDEISKILFIKIMYERAPKKEAIFSLKQFNELKEGWNLSKGKSEKETSYMQRLFEHVKEEFKDDGIFDENEKIKLRENSFEQIVKELEIYNLTSTSVDVKGIAFERFLGRTFRGELGQFFTPREVVNFMVDALEPKENELICDPCSGSGGFLIKVYESVKNSIDKEYIRLKTKKQEEVFGADLESIDNETFKNEYDDFLYKANKEQEQRLKSLSTNSIFGTDANPRMARVSKMNMIMHGDGHNGIRHNDGLLNVNGIFRNRFDVIITNPPFGTTLDKSLMVEEDDRYKNEQTINRYIKEYGDIYTQEMSQVTNNIGKPIRDLFAVGKSCGLTEVLFIERCLDLLKDGGRMGIVLPDGVLNNINIAKARELFISRAKIAFIVSLPDALFSDASVKTSLLFLKKFTFEEAEEYNTIKEEATQKIDAKYKGDIELINSKLKIRGKEALSKDDKKEQRAKLKEIEAKKNEEVKNIIKEKFDYEIPIADIKKAGITATGKKIDNKLIELLKLFKEYKANKNLW